MLYNFPSLSGIITITDGIATISNGDLNCNSVYTNKLYIHNVDIESYIELGIDVEKYAEESKQSADESKQSADESKQSADESKQSDDQSEIHAEKSKEDAEKSKQSADQSEIHAEKSKEDAEKSDIYSQESKYYADQSKKNSEEVQIATDEVQEAKLIVEDSKDICIEKQLECVDSQLICEENQTICEEAVVATGLSVVGCEDALTLCVAAATASTVSAGVSDTKSDDSLRYAISSQRYSDNSSDSANSSSDSANSSRISAENSLTYYNQILDNSYAQLSSDNIWTGTQKYSGDFSINSEYLTSTAISYLKNVTSDIQSQINLKAERGLSGENGQDGDDGDDGQDGIDGTNGEKGEKGDSGSTQLNTDNTWSGRNTFGKIHSYNSPLFIKAKTILHASDLNIGQYIELIDNGSTSYGRGPFSIFLPDPNLCQCQVIHIYVSNGNSYSESRLFIANNNANFIGRLAAGGMLTPVNGETYIMISNYYNWVVM